MEKVQIVIFGRAALVDVDQVKLLRQKEALVNEYSSITSRTPTLEWTPEELIVINRRSLEISRKVISLNRRIRKNVQFI